MYFTKKKVFRWLSWSVHHKFLKYYIYNLYYLVVNFSNRKRGRCFGLRVCGAPAVRWRGSAWGRTRESRSRNSGPLTTTTPPTRGSTIQATRARCSDSKNNREKQFGLRDHNAVTPKTTRKKQSRLQEHDALTLKTNKEKNNPGYERTMLWL